MDVEHSNMIRRPAQFSFRIPDPVALLALAMIVAAAAAGAMEPDGAALQPAEPQVQPMQVETPAVEAEAAGERFGIRLSLFRHG
jgi:hypothetical protein